MLEISVTVAQWEYDDSLKRLRVNDTIPCFDKEEVRENISSRTYFNAQYSYALLYSHNPTRLMFPRPVINMDSTHFKSLTKGKMFSIYLWGSNKRHMLLGIMFVAGN